MTQLPWSTREHLTPIFQQNEVLFGHDSTPGIVAFEIDGMDKVKIFAVKTARPKPIPSPFTLSCFWKATVLSKTGREKRRYRSLTARGTFNHLALFPDLKQLEQAKFHLQKKTGKASSASDLPYWYFSDPIQQFLLLSGKTHFLGMAFRDLKRLQLE